MNDYAFRYISGDFYEGEMVTVEFKGKQYTRRVRYRSDCGLYIVINNTMLFEYECEY